MADEKPSVLVIDDSRTNRRIIVDALADDFQVSASEDGYSALIQAAAYPPDLILLDVVLPEMDGYEVCRRLKAKAETAAIPVIFITAFAEAYDVEKGFEVGAVDYVFKPLNLPIVKARVRNHVALSTAYKRLNHQNRALREAAELREQIEHITRHDLKSPINGILGLVRLLEGDSNLTENQRQTVHLIEDSAMRMLNLINLSLDMYKMERGTYHLQSETVNLIPLIDKIIRDNQSLIFTRKLRISIRNAQAKADQPFLVYGEELLCYSLLSNLMKNAIEASKPQQTITLDLSFQPNPVIRIHNETAVPIEIRDSFFEKFITHGKDQGSGLGTYSARLMAETQGGNIKMFSTESQGTTLEVTLVAPPIQGR